MHARSDMVVAMGPQHAALCADAGLSRPAVHRRLCAMAGRQVRELKVGGNWRRERALAFPIPVDPDDERVLSHDQRSGGSAPPCRIPLATSLPKPCVLSPGVCGAGDTTIHQRPLLQRRPQAITRLAPLRWGSIPIFVSASSPIPGVAGCDTGSKRCTISSTGRSARLLTMRGELTPRGASHGPENAEGVQRVRERGQTRWQDFA